MAIAFNSPDESRDSEYLDRARELVWLEVAGQGAEHVYIVWFCKTLQHWKALVSTDLPDGRYYELTHNGDRNETYVDTYVKESNRVVTT